MADEHVFCTNPMSRGQIVRWMLEDVGQPYRAEILDFTAVKAPAHLAIDPMGKASAIRHGETVVNECAPVCAYLGDAFPQAGFDPPPGDRADGPFYRWLYYAAGPIEAAGGEKALGVVVEPEPRRMIGNGDFGEVMDMMEATVSKTDDIAADAFTAADVYFGVQIDWPLQFGSIQKRPVFKRYWARISERPAAVRARQIDDALIAAQA
jgi:glutathione S-transferase